MFETLSILLSVVCIILVTKRSSQKVEDEFEKFMIQDLERNPPPAGLDMMTLNFETDDNFDARYHENVRTKYLH